MADALDGHIGTLGGRTITNLRFDSDDIDSLSGSEEELR